MAVSLGPGGLTLDNFTIEDDAPNAIVQVKFADTYLSLDTVVWPTKP